MEMNIYTTGSAEFLEIMLNACAMITGSGNAEDLARIGALLGVLLLGFQAAFNNQAITFQKAGLVLVLYMMFYGPTVTTVIEDTVSSQVRVVDNVPLGPAFIGSTISTIAYNITKTSEQAFSTPGMTEYGLFSSLSTLSKVRDALRNPMSLDGFQNYRKSEGWDLPRSVNEYMTFCSLNPVALRTDKTLTDLYRSPGWANVLSNQNSSMFIYVYDGSAGTMKSCSEARSFLNANLQNVYSDVLNDILQKGFSEEAKTGRMTSGVQVQNATDQAIQSLAMSNKSAQDYVLTSLITPMFNDSRVDAMNHWQEQRAAMALRESLNQQEIQWAGKGDSFKHYMRPMIAFFEGMLYAMTPFMAFALMLGSPGLSILGKYLVLPLAVGLWMPLLSIVNAFTLWYAGSQMEAVFNGYDPTGSGFAMLQLMDIDKAIGKALGIGGLLAASVPPLALFIVSGSAMVANGIMNQMTAGDKFKSEDVLPRAQQSSPVMSTTAMYSSDQQSTGASVTGANLQAEQINARQAASALVQSTSSASETATQAYQKNLASAVEQSATTAEGRQNLANLGNQTSSSLNLSENAQYSNAASTLRGLGYSQDSIAASSFAASVGASAPLGLAGGKLEDSEQFKQMNSERQEQTRQALNQLSSAVQASTNKQTLFSSGDAFTSSSQSSLSSKASATLSSSLAEARQAQEAYQRASSSEEAFGAGQNLDLKQAATNSLRKGTSRTESAQQLAELAGSTESGRAAFKTAFNSESVANLSTDRNERMAMAAIRALNQDGRLGDLVSSSLSPFDFNVSTGDSNANAGLAGKSIDTTGLRSEVTAGYGGAQGAYQSEQDMNQSGMEAMLNDGSVVVAGEVAAANNRVDEENDMNQGRTEALRADNAMPRADSNLHTTSSMVDAVKGLARPDESNTLIVGGKQIFEAANSAAAPIKEWIGSHRRPPGIDQ